MFVTSTPFVKTKISVGCTGYCILKKTHRERSNNPCRTCVIHAFRILNWWLWIFLQYLAIGGKRNCNSSNDALTMAVLILLFHNFPGSLTFNINVRT